MAKKNNCTKASHRGQGAAKVARTQARKQAAREAAVEHKILNVGHGFKRARRRQNMKTFHLEQDMKFIAETKERKGLAPWQQALMKLRGQVR